jgi:hypothetical protein
MSLVESERSWPRNSNLDAIGSLSAAAIHGDLVRTKCWQIAYLQLKMDFQSVTPPR